MAQLNPSKISSSSSNSARAQLHHLASSRDLKTHTSSIPLAKAQLRDLTRISRVNSDKRRNFLRLPQTISSLEAALLILGLTRTNRASQASLTMVNLLMATLLSRDR